jgi:hypothetical protein
MEPIVEFVSGQLKEQFNLGFVFVEQRDYARAKECFENIVTLCSLVQYDEGKRQAYISLANLYVLTEDPVMSFKMSAMAMINSSNEHINSQAKDIIVKTLGAAMKYGIESQKKGELQEALTIYRLATPFLKSPKKEAVENEIRKLEEKNDI